MTSADGTVPVHVVERPARALRARIGLGLVRVWLLDPPGDTAGALVAATVNATSPAPHGGLNETALRAALVAGTSLLVPTVDGDARFAGNVPRGGAACVPIADGELRYGYLEAYSERTISFADAAEIERGARELARVIASARATSEALSSDRGTILVCDDDPGIRSLLRLVLTKRGFAVSDVPNGLIALDRCRREPPDLVLIDWVMPIMDGRETTAKLKADPLTRDIPVVMLTAQSQVEDKVAALEAGAQDFLTKPFDPRELVARVEQQLRWRKLLADVPPADDEDAAGIRSPAPLRPAPVNSTLTSTDAAADPRSAGTTAAAPEAAGDAVLPTLDPSTLTGDAWTRAVEAGQLGKHAEALALYVHEAERCEGEKQYPRAAIAFRSAALEAGSLRKPDLANKLLRLAGKMYLTWSETADDARAIQEGYLNAARCFLSAGNLKLAKKSIDFAHSYDAALADDRPSPI